MSEKKTFNDEVKRFKEITKLSGMDYFLIILATVLLLVLYLALHFKIDAICAYILPIGYLLTAFAFLVIFIKQVFGMNKKFDEEAEPKDSEKK